MLLRFALLVVSFLLPFSPAKTFAQDSRTHSSHSSHSSHASHPPYAKTLHLHGVSDVAKVNDFLYRGSQPNEHGMRELKKLGVTTIIDLRGEKQGLVKTERKRAQALGMRVINIHTSGWSPPKDSEIVEFLSLTQQHPKHVIYAHCWLGDDRTGVFFAAYRMAVDHWTAQQALAEMDHFHFKKFWHPAMKKYVLNFPAHFAKSPAFAELRRQQEVAAER